MVAFILKQGTGSAYCMHLVTRILYIWCIQAMNILHEQDSSVAATLCYASKL